MDIIIDDFEHSVTDKMKNHEDAPGFPRLSDYGITEDELSDYLFERQAAIDEEADQKKIYTANGVLMVVPVVVASAFLKGIAALIAGLGTGAMLCLLYLTIRKAMAKARIRRVSTPELERFVSDVLRYEDK